MDVVKLQFLANFIAIIVGAVAIDTLRNYLAEILGDDAEPHHALEAIWFMNTMSVGFTSAVNAYAWCTVASLRMLILIGLACAVHLVVLLCVKRISMGPAQNQRTRQT